MKTIYEVMKEVYGTEAQLDMVIEECSELIKAILKLRRIERKKNNHFAKSVDVDKYLSREWKDTYEQLNNEVARCQLNLMDEYADVKIMLNQLEVMMCGNYEKRYKDKLYHAVFLLHRDFGLTEGKDYEMVD